MLKTLVLSIGLALSLAQPAFGTPEEGEISEIEPKLPYSNSNAWTFNIDDEVRLARHDLTGFTCPFDLNGDYELKSAVQYNMSGNNIGCNYFRRDWGAFITYYIIWKANPADAKTQAKVTIDTLKSIRTFGERTDEIPEADSGIENYAGQCHQIDYELTGEDTPTITGARLCVSGNWIFKTRITRPANENDPARTNHFQAADASFGRHQTAYVEHQSHCAAVKSPDTNAAIVNENDSGTTSLILSLSGAIIVVESKEDSKTRKISEYCTLFDASSDKTSFLFMQNPADFKRPYALYRANTFGREKKPILWLDSDDVIAQLLEQSVSDKTDSKSPKYALWAATGDKRRTLYRLYEALPSHEQFVRDGADALNNDLPALTSISIDEDGNSNIELSISEDE